MQIRSRLKWLSTSVIMVFCLLTQTHALETITYSYDDADQIRSILQNDGTQIDYTYDLLGNRLSKNVAVTGAPINNPPLVPNSPMPNDSATDVDPDTVTLSWSGGDPDPNSQITYAVYYGAQANPPLMAIVIDGQLEIENLEPQSTYYWKVVAKDEKNSSTEGSLWSFSTGSSTPCMPISISPAEYRKDIDSDIGTMLRWGCQNGEAPSNLTYDLYFGTSSNPPLIESNLDEARSWAPELSGEATYYWKVVAKDAQGASTESPIWRFGTYEDLVVLSSQTYSEDTFLPKDFGPYKISGTIVVSSGATLTLDPGTVLEFDAAGYLQIDGAIQAIGTEQAPIVFTSSEPIPAPGSWFAVSLESTAAASTFEHCLVEYSEYGIYINGTAAHSVRYSTFKENSDYGVYVSENSSELSLIGNTINDNVYLSTGAIGGLDTSNTFSENSLIEVKSGLITKDSSWPAGTYKIVEAQYAAFRVQGTDGADGVTTLTLSPGVEIQSDIYCTILIGGSSGDPGALQAVGTLGAPIVFTSSSPPLNRYPGEWYGISFESTAVASNLEHCRVEYADYGVTVGGAAPHQIRNSTFSDNNTYGIYITDEASELVLSGNTIHDSVYISSNAMGGLDSSNIFSGDGIIEVKSGTISKDSTWPAGTYKIVEAQYDAFRVQGTDGADGVTTLTLSPGVEIQSDIYCTIMIGGSSGDPGALLAAGTLSNPVVFTSSSPPASRYAGDWYGISFEITAAASTIDHCRVDFADMGVYIQGTSAHTIQYSSITQSSSYAIYSDNSGALTDAENNWWDNSSGPYDGSDDTSSGGLYNPQGTGGEVSDYVDYDPWLTSDPLTN